MRDGSRHTRHEAFRYDTTAAKARWEEHLLSVRPEATSASTLQRRHASRSGHAGGIGPGSPVHPRRKNRPVPSQRPFRPLLACVAVITALAGVGIGAAHAQAAVNFDGSPGSGPPPGTIGPYVAVPFGDDTRPACDPAVLPPCAGATVSDAVSPAGTIRFSTPAQHREVPTSYASWSNGYRGDVYSFTGTRVVLTLPADTVGLYLYIEPNLYVRGVSATTPDGTTSGVVPVDYTAARYFGFYTTGTERLSTVTVFVEPVTGGGPTPPGRGFAIGEFGIARAKPPAQSLPGVVNGTSWALRDSLTSGPSTVGPFAYGARPMVPLTGDWNGDGTKTPGSYQGGTFLLRNSDTPGAADISFSFGDPRGFPVAGDFDGDGRDDVAVFRNGVWQIRLADGTATSFSFGAGSWPSTVPVAGDWDGDGIDGVGTWSGGTWNLRNTATTGAADAGSFTWAPGAGAYPVVGDWDANGTDTVGVKAGTTWTLRNANAPGPADITFSFGAADDLPVIWAEPRVAAA